MRVLLGRNLWLWNRFFKLDHEPSIDERCDAGWFLHTLPRES